MQRSIFTTHPILDTTQTFALDYTTLSDYLKCPRYYLFRHVIGLVRASDADTPSSALPNRDLHFGSAIHTALEFGYDALSQGAPADEILRASVTAGAAVFTTHPHSGESINWPPPPPRDYKGKTLDNLVTILSAYWNQFLPIDKGATSYLSEMPFSIPITDRMNYCGRMDCAVTYPDGTLRILEHKTAGMLNEAWIASQRGSLQPEGYLTAARVMHDGPSEVSINGILCSQSKTDFLRLPISRPDYLIERFISDLRAHAETLLREHTRLHNFIVDNEQSIHDHKLIVPCMNRSGGLGCSAYFRSCAYLDFCTTMPNPLAMNINPPAGYAISHWDYLTHIQESNLLRERILKMIKGAPA